MKSTKVISRIIDVLILSVIAMYLISAGFRDSRTSGWYQQWFPNLNGSTIKDITFLDSLTGFAVTTPDAVDNGYILRTSNGGDNWYLVQTYPPPNGNVGFTRIQFANSNTGYASTDYFDVFKTTNGGLNWLMYSSVPFGANDMSVINKDTIFVVSSLGLGGGVYRSTNGGINWTRIWTSGNPIKIYMYDKNLGFIQDDTYNMSRTTNGGFNWTFVSGEYYGAIKFYDSNTGWKIWDSLKKTTNGGINWVAQQTPNISYYFTDPSEFSVLNKDTVWMVGAEKFHKPPVYKTTNGGLNWGYQYPDTTLQIYKFSFIQFVNSKVGWINPASPSSLMHTTTGGNDTTIYTGIGGNEAEEITEYELFQNYPNPFNSITNIEFKVQSSKFVNLVIYDILGKEVKTLVNEKKQPGTYQVRFDADGLPSGVYFYSMIIDGKNISTKKLVLLK